jgi:hypothetical protein
VFAPDSLPVAVRADAIVAVGARLAVVGTDGDAILLEEGDPLVEAVEGRPLAVVLGDVDLDGILAVLRPLAAVVEKSAAGAGSHGAAPALVTLPAGVPEPGLVDGGVDWLTAARAAGASPAALSLAEIRDELAVVLVNGLGSLTDRVADPLATRLTDLGLERPAALLREVAARPDPADRLDDLVRMLQVLAVGAVRLAGSASGRPDRPHRGTRVPRPPRPGPGRAAPRGRGRAPEEHRCDGLAGPRSIGPAGWRHSAVGPRPDRAVVD